MKLFDHLGLSVCLFAGFCWKKDALWQALKAIGNSMKTMISFWAFRQEYCWIKKPNASLWGNLIVGIIRIGWAATQPLRCPGKKWFSLQPNFWIVCFHSPPPPPIKQETIVWLSSNILVFIINIFHPVSPGSVSDLCNQRLSTHVNLWSLEPTVFTWCPPRAHAAYCFLCAELRHLQHPDTQNARLEERLCPVVFGG